MSALQSILLPVALGVSSPDDRVATVNAENFDTVSQSASEYELPNLNYFPREFVNSTRGSEIDNITQYQRSYTWNYDVMGEELSGYSLKHAYTDAVGLRSRYVEIGVSRPILDDQLTFRIAGARASGQTGPEERGYGIVVSTAFKMEF